MLDFMQGVRLDVGEAAWQPLKAMALIVQVSNCVPEYHIWS